VCCGGFDLAPMQPFGEPRERERRGRGSGKAHEEERRGPPKEFPQSTCVKLSSKGSPYIGWRGEAYPPTKTSRGGGLREARDGG
jgi:hypothetical protein